MNYLHTIVSVLWMLLLTAFFITTTIFFVKDYKWSHRKGFLIVNLILVWCIMVYVYSVESYFFLGGLRKMLNDIFFSPRVNLSQNFCKCNSSVKS